MHPSAVVCQQIQNLILKGFPVNQDGLFQLAMIFHHWHRYVGSQIVLAGYVFNFELVETVSQGMH